MADCFRWLEPCQIDSDNYSWVVKLILNASFVKFSAFNYQNAEFEV